MAGLIMGGTSVTVAPAAAAGGIVNNYGWNASTGVDVCGTAIVSYCESDITIAKTGTKILIIATAEMHATTQPSPVTDAELIWKASTGRSATYSDYTVMTAFDKISAGGISGYDRHWTTPFLYIWTHGQTATTVINVAVYLMSSIGNICSNQSSAVSVMTLLELDV